MTFLFTPATFPGYNKNDKNNSNNGNSGNNGNGNLENNNSNSQKDKMGKGNSNGDIELISMLSTAGNDELISEVDTYLLNLFSITDDKSNNGNNGNNSGGSNENSNANNNGNGNNSSNQSDNGKNTDNGNNSENGNGNSNAWKDIGAKVDQEKANGKTKDHANKGYDKNTNANGKGYANGKNKDKSNNGKHVGWDKNDNPNTPNDPYDMINPDIFEFTGYINDINQEYTEVLMTKDSEGNYRGAYTYANGERISVEDLGQVEGVPNDPLYYLYDALGTTAAITNMNAGIIDNNRFAPFGEPLSPVAKNSRLTNSPWGYTGESHDIEAGLVYLRARYYEPGTGRFIQEDSHWNPENMIYGDNIIIINKQNTNIPSKLNANVYLPDIEAILQSHNLYVYALNNPLIYVDSSGEDAWGFGVTAYIAFGIRIDIQAFYVEDDSGNKGIMLVGGGGGGTPNAGISGSVFYNATVDTIFDLQGMSVSVGGSGGYIAAEVNGDLSGGSFAIGPSVLPVEMHGLVTFGKIIISW